MIRTTWNGVYWTAVYTTPGGFHPVPSIKNVVAINAVTELVFNVLHWTRPAFTVEIRQDTPLGVKFQRYQEEDGRIGTVCWITKDSKPTWAGSTICHPRDHFHKAIGREIAFSRAVMNTDLFGSFALFWRAYLVWSAPGNRQAAALVEATTEQVELELARRYDMEQAVLRDKWRIILAHALDRSIQNDTPASSGESSAAPDALAGAEGAKVGGG
jgi:hypothetical protein